MFDFNENMDKMMDHNAPWTLRSTDEKRMQTVLYTLLELIRVIAILLRPIIPGSADKILDILEVQSGERLFNNLSAEHALSAGSPLKEPTIIFPRIME